MPVTDDQLRERMLQMPRSILAALFRIGRRVKDGFEGEITISVRRGGIAFIRWIETETGDAIKEELG